MLRMCTSYGGRLCERTKLMLYDPRYADVYCTLCGYDATPPSYLARYRTADAERYLEAAKPEEVKPSDLAVEWRLSAHYSSFVMTASKTAGCCGMCGCICAALYPSNA